MLKKVVTLTILLITAYTYAQQNQVKSLSIKGYKKLNKSFIEKLSCIELNKTLDSARIKEDVIRFQRMPAISKVNYKVVKNNSDNYDITYTIEENHTLIPSANIFTTNEDEFAYRIGVNEFDLFGRNIALGGFFQRDIFNSYAINFRAPYLFSRTTGLAINYQNLTTLEPVFFEQGTADYRYNNNSIEILGLYEIDFKNRFEIGLNFFVEDYKYIAGGTRPNNLNDGDLSNVKKWLIKGIYEYSNLKYHYQYISGFRSLLNLQYVQSTNLLLPDFAIGWNDFFYYKRIGKKGNWANRFRLGLSTNDASPFAPFSVDNNLNIRGVGNVIDRGTGVAVLNTEYRHTLYQKNWFILQGNAFVDFGSWRNPGGEIGDFSDAQNFRVYPGLGLRFMHKKIYNAIFRIDYGVGVTKSSTKGLVFGIGQYF